MLRSFTTLCAVMMIIASYASCGPREADSINITEKPEHGQPVTSEHECTPAQAEPQADMVYSLLPMITPILNIDPFQPWHVSIAKFAVENRGQASGRIPEISVMFGELCPMLKTVTLAQNENILSDGDCTETVHFTVDETLEPHERKEFTVMVDTMASFEASVKAANLAHENPHQGIRIENIEGPLLLVRPFTQSNPCEQSTENDDSDHPLVGIAFTNQADGGIVMTRNSLMMTSFRLRRFDPAAFGEDADFTLSIEGTVMPTYAMIATGTTNTLIFATDIEADGLHIHIPANVAETENEYRLFLSAPQSRGVLRLALHKENIFLPEGAALLGCYPQYSDAYLVLPPEELAQLP